MRTVTFLKRGNNGCTHYRVDLPAKFLRKQGFKVDVIDDVSKINFSILSDTYVFGRSCTYKELEIFRKLKQIGITVIYEIDDNLLDLPSWNQTSTHFLRVQVVIRDFLREANYVIVTTEDLRQSFLTFNKKIVVVDNYIDFDYLDAACTFEIKNKVGETVNVDSLKDRFLLLWAGSVTHHEDLKILGRHLPVFLKKHSNAALVAVHFLNKEIYNAISTEQLFVIPAVLPDKYLALLNKIPAKIGLAPLVEHPFNICKSRLKVIEYASTQLAPLASNFGPYVKCLKQTPFSEFLCNNLDWGAKFEKMYTQTEFSILRESLLSYAQEHFDIKKSNWVQVFSTF